ncbi:hypothetical protein EZV62_017485 [Acer yangbiense]|uniref:Protein kinase domain-containing protein n=1 Tax=Acer yangbiense TaxID=1000413 RepID=A0A5C7HIG6_9ROSI|nr:hypothetical protein EZV62_017485 [Acer yangbiense]
MVDAICWKDIPHTEVGVVIQDILNLLRNVNVFSICFVLRLANKVSHSLAKLALDYAGEFVWLNDYPLSMESLVWGDFPSHGNYGIVYKVRHKRTSDIYALKIIRDIDCDSESQSTSPPSQETKILGFVDSPFVIKCHRVFEQLLPSSGGSKAILMEYMDGGTLDTRRSFSESSLAHIAYQVLKGLEYLHACKIVHLDIKPSNLLVDRDLNVKIADFGVSKIISYVHGSDNYCDSADVGTYAYMSPERLDRDSCRYDPKYVYAGDVWSLGVTLLELFVGHFPFFPPEKKSISWMDLVMVTCLGEPPLSWCIPEEASEELVSFIKCCLEKDPSKRWMASQLLKHPYVLSRSRSD